MKIVLKIIMTVEILLKITTSFRVAIMLALMLKMVITLKTLIMFKIWLALTFSQTQKPKKRGNIIIIRKNQMENEGIDEVLSFCKETCDDENELRVRTAVKTHMIDFFAIKSIEKYFAKKKNISLASTCFWSLITPSFEFLKDTSGEYC